MSIYYRFNNFNSNAKIISNFKYNYYEKDEGATIDTVINSNLEYSTKEITINSDFRDEETGEKVSSFVKCVNSYYDIFKGTL